MKLGRALRSPWLRGGVAVLVLGFAVAAIWWRGPDWGAVWNAFDVVEWRWVIVAVFINLLSVVARSIAWQLTIDQAIPEPHPRYRHVFSSFCVGLARKRRAAGEGRGTRARRGAAPAHARAR